MKRLSRLLVLALLPIGAEIFLHSRLARAQDPCSVGGNPGGSSGGPTTCNPSDCGNYCGQNPDCSCIDYYSNCECGYASDGCHCSTDCAVWGSCGCGCGCGCTEDGCY